MDFLNIQEIKITKIRSKLFKLGLGKIFVSSSIYTKTAVASDLIIVSSRVALRGLKGRLHA